MASASLFNDLNLRARAVAVWAPTWRMPMAVMNFASDGVREESMAAMRFWAEISPNRSNCATFAVFRR